MAWAITSASDFGPYWSVTKFDDIVAVDGDHNTFSSSSENGGIALGDSFEDPAGASFISQDSPRHEAQRKVVTPMFTSGAMAAMASPVLLPGAGLPEIFSAGTPL